MSDLDLFDAVAIKTGEDTSEICRRGFLLDDPTDAGLDHDPDCLFDLIDLPESGTVDWDEVLARPVIPGAVLYPDAEGPPQESG